MSSSDAQAYAASRASQLQSELPAGSQGRVTMGVGVLQDANGNQITVVSTSEPNGYLRPGVTLNPGEVVVPGTGHAEADIVNWAAQNGYTVETIGAGRPICPSCASALSGANAVPATPLKVPK
jgi:filamentous hemagglutinin